MTETPKLRGLGTASVVGDHGVSTATYVPSGDPVVLLELLLALENQENTRLLVAMGRRRARRMVRELFAVSADYEVEAWQREVAGVMGRDCGQGISGEKPRSGEVGVGDEVRERGGQGGGVAGEGRLVPVHCGGSALGAGQDGKAVGGTEPGYGIAVCDDGV